MYNICVLITYTSCIHNSIINIHYIRTNDFPYSFLLFFAVKTYKCVNRRIIYISSATALINRSESGVTLKFSLRDGLINGYSCHYDKN